MSIEIRDVFVCKVSCLLHRLFDISPRIHVGVKQPYIVPDWLILARENLEETGSQSETLQGSPRSLRNQHDAIQFRI